jgi:hypothetical protein
MPVTFAAAGVDDSEGTQHSSPTAVPLPKPKDPMTRRIIQVLRTIAAPPAWAVHFHRDGPNGESAPCFDARCKRPPLSID